MTEKTGADELAPEGMDILAGTISSGKKRWGRGSPSRHASGRRLGGGALKDPDDVPPSAPGVRLKPPQGISGDIQALPLT